MAIPVKNNSEIEKMRAVGKIVADTHLLLAGYIRPGISTSELDRLAKDFILSRGAVSNFKNYRGYPGNICISVNEEIIHGIPGIRKLKDGDIVSIDVGALKDGFNGDAARTYAVGEISEKHKKLIRVTEECFFKGIQFAKAGLHLHQISAAVEEYAEANGFTVVREYTGHGVGRMLHEEPEIPNYRMKSRGPRLCAGMCLAIEPMVNCGAADIDTLADGWTIVTKDGEFSAHYENTVLITDGEPELLTL